MTKETRIANIIQSVALRLKGFRQSDIKKICKIVEVECVEQLKDTQ